MLMTAISPRDRGSSALSLAECGEELGIYSYVGNNPINFVDPLGLQGEDLDDATFCSTYPDRCGTVTGDRGPQIIDVLFNIGNPVVTFSPLRDFGEGMVRWIQNGQEIVIDAAQDAACAIGTAGIYVEGAGSETSEFGVTIVGVGATFMGAGVITAQPEVVVGGAAIVDAGAVIAGGGGLVALGGAGMRAVGGDYRSAITRGAIRIISRFVPIDRGSRSVSTNNTNQAAADPTQGVPACGARG
jgi:hypothetical protein